MRSGPWDLRSTRLALLMNLAAGTAVATGWFLVAGQVDPGDQIAWLGLGAMGLVVALVANARFILGGRRAVGAALRDAAADLTSTARVNVSEAPTATDAPTTGYVAGPGLLRYHRATCPMAQGRSWPVRDLEELQDGTRQPCGVCRP